MKSGVKHKNAANPETRNKEVTSNHMLFNRMLQKTLLAERYIATI